MPPKDDDTKIIPKPQLETVRVETPVAMRLYQSEAEAYVRTLTDTGEARQRRQRDPANNPRKSDVPSKTHGLDEDAVFVRRYANLIGRGANPDEAFPSLHPISIARELLAKRGYSADEQNRLGEILEKSFPRDTVTGFYAKHAMPLIVGMAHRHAQHHRRAKVCLVEGDISNLGGANAKLEEQFPGHGREYVDKLIHKICEITQKAFYEYAKAKDPAKAHHIQVMGVRAGGDELRLVTYGLTQAEVDEVLEKRVHPAINRLSAQYGLHDLPHSKKGKMPGFGAAFASVDLGAEPDMSNIVNQLNDQIEIRKREDGLMRMGVVNAQTVDRYMDQVLRPYLEAEGITGIAQNDEVEKQRPVLENIAAKVGARWDKMRKPGSDYVAGSNVKEFADPQLYFDKVAENFEELRESVGFKDIKFTPESREKTPFQHVKVSKRNEPMEATRLRQTFAAFDFRLRDGSKLSEADGSFFKWDPEGRRFKLVRDKLKEIPEEQRPLLRTVIDLMQSFDALDPPSRCKAAHLLPEDALEYLARQPDGHMRVAHFELSNINGLNNVSYELSDAALRQVGKYIQLALREHDHGMGDMIMSQVYHKGGGQYVVLLPGDYPDFDIMRVKEKAFHMLMDEICDKPIEYFARNTIARADNPNAETIIDKLNTRIRQVEKDKKLPKLVHMGDIPHPKGKSLLALNSYSDLISQEEVRNPTQMANTLRSLNIDAEHHFASHDPMEVPQYGR